RARFPPPMRRLRVPRTRRPRLTAILLSLAVAAVVHAELPGEAVGKVTVLPARPGPHWFWLSDILLHRTALFDADTGELLGTLSAGTAGAGFVIAPLFAPDHREVHLPEPLYSRGGRGEPFFDPQKDPVTEKAVRRGNEWLFVSFEGVVHPVDMSGETPRFGETWSLVDDAGRRASWRIGGAQHLAVHAASGRLYALMHQGG